MKDLKARAVRGGFAKLCAQFVNAVVRVGSLMILARLLSPAEFGLVAMVTAFIGVFGLFRDLGLSTATIQQKSVTDAQLSALFWINILVGALLTAIVLASAPLVAEFYREPRLVWICVALSFSFIINAVGIQHASLLERQMRFVALAAIETGSSFVGILVGIGMAFGGAGYWALVGTALATPTVYSIAAWIVSGWTPRMQIRRAGVGGMVRIGGIVTANGLVVYIAYNIEKVLLGRFWGADALGIYGRAYQLINIPTENLNSAIGAVTLSAMSRLKDEPGRLRNCFLKSYALLISMTLPITAVCVLLGDDLVYLILGRQWSEAAPIFRLLAPTILIFGMINPLWPLLVAHGQLMRSFRLAIAVAIFTIAGYTIGLPWGPKGVALGLSTMMTLWVGPHIVLSIRGTGVSTRDIVACIGRPFLATCVAAVPAGFIAFELLESSGPALRLVAGAGTLVGLYAWVLMIAMNQKAVFLDALRGLKPRSA